MSIKNKKMGPVPMYPQRWQELAKDPNRLPEAAREYMAQSKERMGLTSAHRHVKEFHREHMRKFGGR